MKLVSDYRGKCATCEEFIQYNTRCTKKGEDHVCLDCHMTNTMSPWDDRLLVKVVERPTEIGGIDLPEGAIQQRSEIGTILKMGETVPEVFHIGDQVVFTFYQGVHIQLPETLHAPSLYRVLNADAVLMFYKE